MAAAPSRRKPDPCPECGGPTILGGRFCRGCGWDADLAESEDGHLDGVDLPQGYGPGEEEAPAPASRAKRVLWTLLALLALAGFVMTSVL